MSPTQIADPNVTVKNLIRDNWDASNILGTITPDFHTGWYNHGSNVTQLTFPFGSPDDSPIGGGDAGYTGIEGGGSGPVQDRAGTLFPVAWAHREMDDVQSAGLGAGQVKDLVYQFYQEVDRIITNNATGLGDLESLAVLGVSRGADNEFSPVAYRVDMVIGYTWRKFP